MQYYQNILNAGYHEVDCYTRWSETQRVGDCEVEVIQLLIEDPVCTKLS